MDRCAWKEPVSRFCNQYLQLERDLDYPQGQLLKQADVQDAIYLRLFADGAVQYGPPPRYQLRVLKELVSKAEAAIDDWDQYGVSDHLMSTLAVLLCTPLPSEVAAVQQKSYVTYHLSSVPCIPRPSEPAPLSTVVNDPHVTLLENRTLLSAAGTTGLRTWDSAFHLGQYLSRNPSIVSGKRILELGAGTGYVSILCANYLGAVHTIASDGSDNVVDNLPNNLFLNQLQGSDRIQPMDIKWGHALVGTEEEKWNGGRPVDVVLGADVTYNEKLFAHLIATLVELFTIYPKVEVYLSAAQRNQETFQAFMDRCNENRLAVDDQNFDICSRQGQCGPFYDDSVPIRICKLSKA